MNKPHKIEVGLGERSYEVLVGTNLLTNAGELVRPVLKRSRTVIVTDENVAPLHLQNLKEGLSKAEIDTSEIILPAGEKTKSFSFLEHLCEELLACDVERSDHIIALGGGVIGDLTGFAASVLRRGCRFIQIPTTLLAQVDSSVGGKTAINAKSGKNLVGAFHQPGLVLADIGALETLPRRQILAGYAEVVKYGLLGDASFFFWLEENAPKLIAGDKDALSEAVRASIAAKARIVEEDETEQGRRALLNLGHTFGHALEAQMGYSNKLLHGESVAIGMAMAFAYSQAQGLCSGQDVHRVIAHLKAVGLPSSLQDIPDFKATSEELMAHIAQDKKVSAGKLTFILATAIGDAFVAKDVPKASVEEFLQSCL